MVKHILIVDDDPHIREVVSFALENAGMRITEAKDGADALSKFSPNDHNLIVLDINMPEMDGLDVCREIRKTSDVPILFLSSRDDEIDKIVGLELGADDYLTKPFSPRELIARIKAILKRMNGVTKSSELYFYREGDLSLDINKHQVFWGENEVILTATEFSIIQGMI
ncbi:MAG: response regulator transcription factor, partial [Emcibacteraceae bacterium]|nr:response regulator transcription factor [Emcibacteraceae bacterium]